MEDVLVQPLVQVVHAVVEGEDDQLRGAGGCQVTWGGGSDASDDGEIDVSTGLHSLSFTVSGEGPYKGLLLPACPKRS